MVDEDHQGEPVVGQFRVRLQEIFETDGAPGADESARQIRRVVGDHVGRQPVHRMRYDLRQERRPRSRDVKCQLGIRGGLQRTEERLPVRAEDPQPTAVVIARDDNRRRVAPEGVENASVKTQERADDHVRRIGRGVEQVAGDGNRDPALRRRGALAPQRVDQAIEDLRLLARLVCKMQVREIENSRHAGFVGRHDSVPFEVARARLLAAPFAPPHPPSHRRRGT